MRLRAEGTGATTLLTTGKWPGLCSATRMEEGSGCWALPQVESQNAEAGGGLTEHQAQPLLRWPWAVCGVDNRRRQGCAGRTHPSQDGTRVGFSKRATVSLDEAVQ